MDDINQENDQNISSDSPNIKGTTKREEDSTTQKKPLRKFFNRENFTVIFTGLIFFATSVYTIFSILQWQAMRDAPDKAETSNIITREALEFTKKLLCLLIVLLNTLLQ